MKKILLSSVFLMHFVLLQAQYQNATWMFGDSASLHFNGTNAPVAGWGALSSIEACASISNNQGNILFYTDGMKVWNRQHQVMPNGTGLLGGKPVTNQDGSSSTQGALIIPFSNDTNKFFIFTLYDFGIDTGLHYSIIDLTLDGGDGDVAQKNILLYHGKLTEKMTAVRHGNGQDWWVFVHKLNNNQFLRFLISDDQIALSDSASESIGSVLDSPFGCMAISPDGSKLVTTTWSGEINLFQLDRCSGLLSEFIDLSNIPNSRVSYGCCFSPNNEVLYISNLYDDIMMLKGRVFQFDLTNSDILSSRLEIDSLFGVHDSFGHMLTGSDNKIYIARGQNLGTYDSFTVYNQNLGVINNPNIVGFGCNMEANVINLGAHRSYMSLPNSPNYNLGALSGSPCDTLIITGVNAETETNGFETYPNPTNSIITIQFANLAVQHLLLKNLLCEVVLQKELTATQTQVTLDMSNLPAGVYVLLLQTKDKVWEEKVCKQ